MIFSRYQSEIEERIDKGMADLTQGLSVGPLDSLEAVLPLGILGLLVHRLQQDVTDSHPGLLWKAYRSALIRLVRLLSTSLRFRTRSSSLRARTTCRLSLALLARLLRLFSTLVTLSARLASRVTLLSTCRLRCSDLATSSSTHALTRPTVGTRPFL